MSEVNRRLLGQSGLSTDAMEAALDLAGLRPSREEWRDFAVRAMRFAGVLSLAAGMIFFVAYNWQHVGIYGRFVIVQIPLVATLAIAWIKGLEKLSGKLALMLAVLLAGALLALFGQTYQTGADVYELFLGWAALTLPWVIACRYAPCWALWLLLANAAVGLYAGTGQRGWMARVFFDPWQWSPWSAPFLLDLLFYVTVVSLSRWRELGLSDSWLRRGVMALAMMFGTFSTMYRVGGGGGAWDASATLELLLFIAASGGFAVYTYTRKEDLFNFAVLALSWIAVTTTMLARSMVEGNDGVGALFIIAIYLIGASTGAVKGISYLGQQWRMEGAAR